MAKQDGWTKTPNIILNAIPEMSEAELKLTMVLVRLTFGYHREDVRLTYNDMSKATGLSKPAISDAIDRIEEKGFFLRGRRSMWSINSKNFLPNDHDDSKDSLPNDADESKKSLPYKSKNYLPSQLNKKKKEKELATNIPQTIPFKPVKNRSKAPKGEADKRIDAILAVCGMDRSITRHLQQAENVAAQLMNYTAADIYDRYRFAESPNGHWCWYRDDWRGSKGQQPKPDDILETISKERVNVTSASNGRHPSIPKPAPDCERIPGAQ